MKFKRISHLKGEITVPGDKSISHRSIMFGSIANGTTEIHNFLQGEDCRSTIACFQELGIRIHNLGTMILVNGKGLRGLTLPTHHLDCGNSGTTMRLISGILAAQTFDSVLTGDDSLKKRPMKRIITPLSQMGADIHGLYENQDLAPLQIKGKQLHGIHYQSSEASAQVKSAILLAGLYADSETSVTEPYRSRNHSELMLKAFGADLTQHETTVTIKPLNELQANKIVIPGDISSAAFFIAAALMVPNSEVMIKQVGINPTRDGILQICRSMGANISVYNQSDSGEPMADILVKSSLLMGISISGAIIPTLIDELPIIAVLACLAEGETIIKDAQELKIKESNRIEVMVKGLTAMGADVTETIDGMIIRGGRPLHGAVIDCQKDHRIAMSFAVAGLCASGETEIRDAECVTISYPEFYSDLASLCN